MPYRPANPEKYRDGEWLEQKYHGERLSAGEIADICDCSKQTILRWLKRHGISVRDKSEAAKIRAERYESNLDGNRVKSIHPNVFTHKDKGYERIQCGVNKEQVSHHRLLAVAEHGFDAVRGKVVHHKSNIPWDNRPENLEMMDNDEHSKMHAIEQWETNAPF